MPLSEVFLRGAASISRAAGILRTRLSGFEEGWNMVKPVDSIRVLITTAADIEDRVFDTVAAREGLKKVDGDRGGIESVQEYFGIAGVRLFQVRSSAGTTGPSGATLVSARAIERKDPHYIICCGICFGMKPDTQRLGDVIISEQVSMYEPGRMQDKHGQPEFISRGGKVFAGPTLLDRARLVRRGWPEDRSHVGLVASGDKLVDSAPFKRFLLTVAPEAIGGEMESAGVFSSTIRLNKEGIVIKGICDWGENKDKVAQQEAAENAFLFAMEVVRKL
jgi:nucleoside phosphorylase